MQAPSTALVNADYRTLPPGWVAHYDQQRNMWYYVNLNATPPVASFVHPDDQRDRTSYNQTARLHRDAVPKTSTSRHEDQDQDRSRSMQTVPPFVAVTEAHGAKGPTFAQRLYARSLPNSLSSNEGYSHTLSAASTNARPSSSHARSSEINVYATPPLSPIAGFSVSSSSSSSGLSPPSSQPRRTPPNVSQVPSRRPRGARNPTFPRTSFSNLKHPLVDESTDEFGVRIVSQNQPAPNSVRTLDNRTPLTEVTSHHPRSATVPTIVFNTTSSIQSQKQNAKAKQVPNHKITICSPNALPVSAQISTPAFQVFNGSQPVRPPSEVPRVSSASPSIRPVLPPIIIPNSSPSPAPRLHTNGISLPTGAAIPYINQQKVYLPPTQNSMAASTANNFPQTVAQGSTPSGHTGNGMVSNPNPNHELLKKVGVAVGKTAGKAALRLGTKMVLENIGISADIDDGNLMDTVSSGISGVAVSAASHAITAAANFATSSSTNTGAPPPPSSTYLSPEYTAILQQMEAMQWNQQYTPQPNSLDPSEIANIIATMHAMQIEHDQHKPLAQNPLGNISAPYGLLYPGHMQNSSPQPPHWQPSFVNSVIGGATNGLVSGAVANFDFAGTTENAMSSFPDFSSFEPSTS